MSRRARRSTPPTGGAANHNNQNHYKDHGRQRPCWHPLEFGTSRTARTTGSYTRCTATPPAAPHSSSWRRWASSASLQPSAGRRHRASGAWCAALATAPTLARRSHPDSLGAGRSATPRSSAGARARTARSCTPPAPPGRSAPNISSSSRRSWTRWSTIRCCISNSSSRVRCARPCLPAMQS